jgi:hypothetical protein
MRCIRRTIILSVIAPTTFWATSFYRPPAPIPEKNLKQYRAHLVRDISAPDLLEKYDDLPETTDSDSRTKLATRNRLIREYVWLVDDSYHKFELDYYRSDATVNFASDALNIGLAGLASVTGTAHVKSVLAAIAAGTTGIKSSFEKHFYDQQTRTVIVQKMRAMRTEQISVIEDHLRLPLEQYDLAMGMEDVSQYYTAGTVLGALQGISGSAASQAAEARLGREQKIQRHR